MATRVGQALVERVYEQTFPVPFTLMTGSDGQPPSGAAGSFEFVNQSWLVRVDGLTVLVDPCNGNGRERPVPSFNDRDLPWMDNLRAVGVAPDDVDIVFSTHLHNDHCGWNTVQVESIWVPTFPRARYLFAQDEYRRWDPDSTDHSNSYNESVFDECVRPVVEAGRAEVIVAPYQVSPSLVIEPAAGHTEGHAVLHLHSGAEQAWFTGDAFHHPVQVSRPDLHLPGCDDLAMAIRTRTRLAERIHRDGALMFPAHFAAPHYGTVRRDGEEFVFVPA